MPRIPRVVVSGTASGVGKTSVACAVIHGLRERGYSVQPFKAGPDYIDPGYLSSASGRAARNLDAWLMGARGLREEFVRSSGSDVSVVEGVMGYYDGFSGGDNRASTHHIATITRSETVVVLDAGGAARSVAAAALGFARFHRRSRISGVVLNRVGSRRHESLCREALRGVGIPVAGAVPRDPGFSLESRHLGLVPAGEAGRRMGRRMLRAARAISEFIDFDLVLGVAGRAPDLPEPAARPARRRRCSVAVALDDSFNFYYPANLESLRREGARIRYFSPVSDGRLPECDGVYLGGGFPEVLAPRLAENSAMRAAVRRASEGGAPLYAECGGLMYLTKSIRDGRRRHPMAGALDAETRMTGRVRLGYTKARVVSDCAVSRGGRRIRGHEFHYSELEGVPGDTRFAYDLEIGHGILDGRDGIVQGGTLASYGHLFLDGGGLSRTFVDNCASFSRR